VSEQTETSRSSGKVLLFAALQIAVTVGIFVILANAWGLTPFIDAFMMLPWWSFPAAVILGGIGVLTQALRWRVIAEHHSIAVPFGPAVARCWQSSFLNGVLPGGLAGDALRAADDSSDADVSAGRSALGQAFAAMAAERLMGTAVVFIAAGLSLLTLAPVFGLASLGVAAVAIAVSWRWLRPLSLRDITRVVVFSAVGWAAFSTLFTLTISAVTPDIPLALAPALAAVSIAGMSIPLGFGGWGPREAAAAWAFSLAGFAPHLGVTASVSYGLLALASTLPGAVILAVRVLPRLDQAKRARSQRRARRAEHREPIEPSF